MGENKKYYWLKLKEGFFRDKEIKKLRKIAGGDTYTIIYLKLQLLSLKREGKLIFENLEDSFAEEMALELDENTENVKMTLLYLQKCGLIEEVAENEFMLPQAMKSIGTETQGAERVRRHRENKRALQCNTQPLLSNTTVTNCNTEIDIEKREKRKDIEKEPHVPFLEIIEYLNLKANKQYKATTTKTKEIIMSRWNENFTLEDFKKVIDIKVSEWSKTDMEKYLRPETLFSNKFEGYLNQPTKIKLQKPKSEPITRRADF